MQQLLKKANENNDVTLLRLVVCVVLAVRVGYTYHNTQLDASVKAELLRPKPFES
jgi:hypothetical protein